MSQDPVTSLIETLKERSPLGTASGSPGAMSEVADLVPDRRPTQVPDVGASQLLQQFRQQRERGLVEIAVVEGLFELVRSLLILRGITL